MSEHPELTDISWQASCSSQTTPAAPFCRQRAIHTALPASQPTRHWLQPESFGPHSQPPAARVTPPSPGPQNNMELGPTGTFTATRPVSRGQELLWRYGIHYWGTPSPLDLWVEAQEARRRLRRPS
jgi:hypothetical protein